MASWADADAAHDAPELGPLDLRALSSRLPALPPLAVVFDSEPANRALARRLVARGFPAAWFTHDAKNAVERGGVCGARARARPGTPRGGGVPPAAARRRRRPAPGVAAPRPSAVAARLRPLDALSLSGRAGEADRKGTNPFRKKHVASASVTSGGPESEEEDVFPNEDDVFGDPEPGVDDDGVGVARTSLASYEKPFGTAEDDESNPLLVILAVSGDAEVESALERLLAGERSSSAKYVDRALLAGAVLVLTGPVSDPPPSSAAAAARGRACAWWRRRRKETRVRPRRERSRCTSPPRRCPLRAAAPALAALARAHVGALTRATRVRAAGARGARRASRDARCGIPTRVRRDRRRAVAAGAIALREAARRCGRARRRAWQTSARRRRQGGAASRRARDRAMERNAELRAEVDSKTAECARLASACASMDGHLHMDGEDEKTKEIDALRAREAGR